MRTVSVIVIFLLTAVRVSAQDRYFLVIQTEDRQPFYVRVANKTWSSTSVGHLVVPSLGDSTYQLSLGFPQNKYPEQSFLVTFNRKDLGYTLKQGGDEGWALVSWENGEKVQPRPAQAKEAIWYGERKKDDAFTTLMAAVVNDSSVLYVASVKSLSVKQEVFANANPAPKSIQDSATAIAAAADSSTHKIGASVDSLLAVQSVTDTAFITTTGPAQKDSAIISGLTVIKDTPATAGPILVYTAPKPSVSMVQDHIHPKGRNMIFTDSSSAGVDTISVIIDAEPDTVQAMAEEKPVVKSADPVKSGNTAVDTTATKSNTIIVNPEPVKTVTQDENLPARKDSTGEEKKKLVLINSDCANFATDSDIDKLRVKMMEEPTTESKLAATKKLFKSKCIYTRQIKALSELFPNDEARYKFFEHCYPFTADTAEFRSLMVLLSEDAYIARFKTLVRIKD